MASIEVSFDDKTRKVLVDHLMILVTMPSGLKPSPRDFKLEDIDESRLNVVFKRVLPHPASSPPKVLYIYKSWELTMPKIYARRNAKIQAQPI
jgi:hypothetical protein